MTERELAGRHALVTGAGTGIGAAIARELAARGARVTLAGRRFEPLAKLGAELGAHAQAVSLDVCDAASLSAGFDRARAGFGPIAILVNNAGQAETAPLLRTSAELWSRMLEVNLTGSFLCMQAALPDMRAAGWGRVINIASTAALKGYAYVAAYTAAKHGVLGLTRAAALEFAREGITVNAVCPGYTETEILAASLARVVAKTGRTEAQAREDFLRGNPQGRFVAPHEVAEAVAWLAAPGAAAMTGQAIAVAGGEVM